MISKHNIFTIVLSSAVNVFLHFLLLLEFGFWGKWDWRLQYIDEITYSDLWLDCALFCLK